MWVKKIAEWEKEERERDRDRDQKMYGFCNF